MGKIYCVMGKSSSGKDTVSTAGLCSRGNPALLRIVPYTTRPRRRERRMAGNMYLQMRHMYSSWKAQAR